MTDINALPIGEATESTNVDEAIALATNDIMADIAHHCDWLEVQRKGAAQAFLRHLAGIAGVTSMETEAANGPTADGDAIANEPRTGQVVHIGGKTMLVPTSPIVGAAA